MEAEQSLARLELKVRGLITWPTDGISTEECFEIIERSLDTSAVLLREIQSLEVNPAGTKSSLVRALDIMRRHAGDEEHHNAWVIDQVARVLLGDEYDAWVAETKAGEHGPDSYSWNTGIAP